VPGRGTTLHLPGCRPGRGRQRATRVTEEMFFAAAKTLAAMVTEEDAPQAHLSRLDRIRESPPIAVAVAEVVFRRGLTKMNRPADLAGM